MIEDEYEAATIERALAGDPDAGRDALGLCHAGLADGALSRRLAAYLGERLRLIDLALDEEKKLRAAKKSSGSIRSARDAAIAEALCIKRPAKKPRNPLPVWQKPYAAFGTLLLNAGLRPERVYAAMDEARRLVEGKDKGLDRSDAQKILKSYRPLRNLGNKLRLDKADDIGDYLLRDMAGPLREILPTYYPQPKRE